MRKMFGQIMEMVKTNRNVTDLIDRGFSANMTNITTVAAHRALETLIDLQPRTLRLS